VTALPKPRAELDVVVDLAIEDQPDRAVFISHRLMPGRREIYDGQPPMAESDAAIDIQTAIVRTAMQHGVAHRAQLRLVNGPSIKSKNTDDTAH
jgi:hypothetical protein